MTSYISIGMNSYQKEGDIAFDSSPEVDRLSRQGQLPHWRMGTDCSGFSFDCFSVAQQQRKYKPYPFNLSVRKSIESNTTATHNGQWPVETIKELQNEWIEFLEKEDLNKAIPVEERNYLYPPTVPDDEYESCMDLTIRQNKSTTEQIEILMSGSSPRLAPEPDTNMLAFTISDYVYVKDMLHDVFQMMDNVVGFSDRHFFLVALDKESVQLACKYGYSVVFWKADESLVDAVANTKLILSYEFAKRGIDTFFTEMDVWWIRSPKQHLIDFQKQYELEDERNQKHLYFSTHQLNPNAANIGVYAVKANKYTEEYFRVCIDVLNQRPETHDQYVMQDVLHLFRERSEGKDYAFVPYTLTGIYKPHSEEPPKTPEIKYPFKALMFSHHEIASGIRPTTTLITLAIHTLSDKPLTPPFGKQMNAKELGVYYGFHSNPKGASYPNTDAAGYYDRSGTHRRYLWLDTSIRNNFYSFTNPDHYKDKETLEWILAMLIAIARKTNRILVLPQIFHADKDAGTYNAWALMDYSKVKGMVDFREANFVSNPKAWRNGEADTQRWPFETVVNTALFRGTENEERSVIYTQISDRSSITSTKVWKVDLEDQGWLDAWIGSLSSVPEVDSAEVLLINPDAFMGNGRSQHMKWRLQERQKKIKDLGNDHKDLPPVGRMELEVSEIYNLLGWCWRSAFRHTANKVAPADACLKF